MSSSSLDTKDKVDWLHKKAKDLLKQNKAEEEIILELRNDGITEDYAKIIIENIQNDLHDKRSFWKLIFSGIFFILSGLTINYLSYRIAANQNAIFFYLFWGIIVVGIGLLFKAFIIFRK